MIIAAVKRIGVVHQRLRGGASTPKRVVKNFMVRLGA
jgi:hypothetical protein